MTYSIISRHRAKLMGVAALWIYVFHILPAPAFWEAQGIGKVWWYVRNAGFCGVDIFLFLSGLGLVYSLERHPITDLRSCGKFLWRRFCKIYITFLPFTVIYALLDGWGIGLFLKRLFCLDQFSSNLYNFSWYVCCILLMYLLTPVLHRMVSKKPGLTAVLGVCYLAALLGMQQILRWDLYAIAVRLPVFVLGLWAAKLSLSNRNITAFGWVLGCGMLLAGLVLSYGLNAGLIFSPLPACNALVNVLLAPALVLLLSAAFEWMEGRSWFGPVGKVLTFFGGISFEFYLLQEWYVRRGLYVLPAQRKIQHVIVFCVMVGLSVALQKLSGLLKKIPAKK